MITALVPVKENSERIPGKNQKLFCGQPLFTYVLKLLQSCSVVDEIIVDTDCDAVAEFVNRNISKGKVIERPEHLRGDEISANALIEFDLKQSAGEHFLQTHCTNPLLTLRTVESAVEKYFTDLKKHDSLFAVNQLQSRMYSPEHHGMNHIPEKMERTQDMTPVYEENSNFFIFSRTSFRENFNNRIGCCPQFFVMNKIESVDIDYADDFTLAELIYENRDRFPEIFEKQ